MKAAQVTAYGDPAVMKINEVDKPTAGPGQVLVEVHAASLNPWDTTLRSGKASSYITLEFPFTAGGDLAGVITEVGAEVAGLKAGDKVYGSAGVKAGSGAFAEFAATPVDHLALAPDNLDPVQQASLPLVGVSAVQAVVEHINLRPGQKIFIHGGAGGIGSIAIQIAKNIGGYIATTATGADVERVKQLGADEVVDYKAQDFSQVLHDYDAVFDTVGHGDFNKALNVLKRGGVGVTMIDQVDEAKAAELGVITVRQSTEVNQEHLNALRELVEAGKVTPQVGKVFPLGQVVEAFTVRESGGVSGKIVLKIQ